MPARLAAALLLAAALAAAGAADCQLAVQGVAFGAYDVFASQASVSAGRIEVDCDVATAYQIALSPGSGSHADRRLQGSGDSLAYNLYVDPTFLTIWGDGSGGSASVAGMAEHGSHTVYGRLPAGQVVGVGAYADSIVVTVSF